LCHRSSIGKGKQVVRSPKGEPDYQPSKASGELSALDYKKYLNLETYRRNGAGVRTPVWFAAGPKDDSRAGFPKFYVYTIADSGKAKRIRRSSVVRIAPCDMRGKVTGSWTNALAEVVTGEEFELGMRLLDRKYFPWKQILNLSAMLFRRRERVVLAIRPVPTDASSGDSAVGQ
jgi:PPOX class probable F420-dependent enzyme